MAWVRRLAGGSLGRSRHQRPSEMSPHVPHAAKSVRVCAFVNPDLVDAVRRAGADIIGSLDLVDALQRDGTKAISFDKVVATPDQMPVVSKAARLLVDALSECLRRIPRP